MPGKFSFRVADVRGRSSRRASQITGIGPRGHSTTRPAPTGQRSSRSTTRAITFPSFGVTGIDPPQSGGTARPRRPRHRLLARRGASSATAADRQPERAERDWPRPRGTPALGRLGGILEFDDLRIGVNELLGRLRQRAASAFNGSIFFASGGAQLLPGQADLGDDHRPPDGRRPQPGRHAQRRGDAARAARSSTARSTRSSSRSTRSTIKISTLRRRSPRVDFMLNTGASADQELVSFGVGRREGQDRLARARRRGAATSPSSATARSRPRTASASSSASAAPPATASSGRPSCRSRSTRSASSGSDIENHPEDFELTCRRAITGIKGVSGLEFTRLDRGHPHHAVAAAAGQVPDHPHRLARRHRQGRHVRRRDRRRHRRRHPAPGPQLQHHRHVRQHDAGRTSASSTSASRAASAMAGMAGFTIRVGLSELGPLSAFINVEMPGRHPARADHRPDDQRLRRRASSSSRRCRRSTTRSRCARATSQLPTAQTADEWLNGAPAPGRRAGQGDRASTRRKDGFLAAFTSPMTITGSARRSTRSTRRSRSSTAR